MRSRDDTDLGSNSRVIAWLVGKSQAELGIDLGLGRWIGGAQ
jgi:hypothetical protein